MRLQKVVVAIVDVTAHCTDSCNNHTISKLRKRRAINVLGVGLSKP